LFSLNPLRSEISLTNLETIKKIEYCASKCNEKQQKSSGVFAKYSCNHDNYRHRAVFASVTLLAKLMAEQ
jgi:hypothetical protein